MRGFLAVVGAVCIATAVACSIGLCDLRVCVGGIGDCDACRLKGGE